MGAAIACSGWPCICDWFSWKKLTICPSVTALALRGHSAIRSIQSARILLQARLKKAPPRPLHGVVRVAVRGFEALYVECDGDAGPGEIPFCQANNVVEPLANWTPTIAPSGADLYMSDRIPAWRGSLLFTTLGGRALYRLTLSADGRRVTAQERLYYGTFGRLRDVLVAPDGIVYLATSDKDGRGSPGPNDDRIIRLRPNR